MSDETLPGGSREAKQVAIRIRWNICPMPGLEESCTAEGQDALRIRPRRRAVRFFERYLVASAPNDLVVIGPEIRVGDAIVGRLVLRNESVCGPGIDCPSRGRFARRRGNEIAPDNNAIFVSFQRRAERRVILRGGREREIENDNLRTRARETLKYQCVNFARPWPPFAH